VLSKRKLIQLVVEKHVEGWDDPRIADAGRGAPARLHAEGFRLFAERIGVSKSDAWIDYGVLEECMREHLNEVAPRRTAVLDPLKLVIDNYPEGAEEQCLAPNHPQKPELGKRAVPFAARAVDRARGFHGNPGQGIFPPLSRQQGAAALRLRGRMHRLRQGRRARSSPCAAIISPTANRARRFRRLQGEGKHPLALGAACLPVRSAPVRPVFKSPHPGAGDRDFLLDINPDAKKVISAQLEPALKDAKPEERFQFERHGYFVADRYDSKPGAPVFNRAVTLKDAWQK